MLDHMIDISAIIALSLSFEKLVTFRWGDTWNIPFRELGIIAAVIVIAVILAVRNPIRKMKELSIVDTISTQ